MTTYRSLNDALDADRVACQARKIEKKPLSPGSSAHRIQKVVCHHEVFCVIEKPTILIRSNIPQ